MSLSTDETEAGSTFLPDWGVKSDNEDDGDDDGEPVKFGEDQLGWKWVVGLNNGTGKVMFVRVPNRKSNTLNAIILNTFKRDR